MAVDPVAFTLNGALSSGSFFFFLWGVFISWLSYVFMDAKSRIHEWPCPSCGRKGSMKALGCHECGLSKWAPDDSEENFLPDHDRNASPTIKHRTESDSICPYCKTTIEASGEGIVRCLWCTTFHHQDCWNQNGHCAVFNCPGTATVQAPQRIKE